MMHNCILMHPQLSRFSDHLIRSGTSDNLISEESVAHLHPHEKGDMGLLSTNEQAFLDAAHGGRLKKLQELLNGGVDILTMTPQEEKTALHVAAAAGHAELVRFLLSEDDDGRLIDAKNHEGVLAVDLAARNQHVNVLQVFAERGVDGRQHLNKALVRACGAGNERPVAVLLQFVVDPNTVDVPSALCEAAESGHVAIVKALLKHGADVNKKTGENDTTPLHCAARNGHDDIVKALLAHGVEVDAHESTEGFTALHEACRARPEAEGIVLQLLEYGFDPNIKTETEWTPLLHACAAGNSKIAAALLERVTHVDDTGRDGSTALAHACASGISIDVVRTLLDRGANPLLVGGRRQTMLHAACQGGSLELVKLFLSLGVDVNAVEWTGKTALHYAVWERTGKIVEILLQHGAAAQIADGASTTAFDHACSFGYVNVVRVFLNYEPYSDENEKYFDSALSMACTAGRITVVELLLECGAKDSNEALKSACNGGQMELVEAFLANYSILNESLDASLIAAASCGHHEIVVLLLAYGANIHARDSDNRTALHCACTCGSEKTVANLLKRGVDINAEDVDGSTSLHIATTNGYAACVKVLLDYGADSSISDMAGWTALHYACRLNDAAVIEPLLSNYVDVTTKTPHVETPLHIAAMSSSHTIIPLLVDHGADVQARDQIWYTPLEHCLERDPYYSSFECPHDTAYELVKHGAGSPDSFGIDHNETVALDYVVEWWINEREEGKPLTRVPVDVLSEGRANTEAYLKALCIK